MYTQYVVWCHFSNMNCSFFSLWLLQIFKKSKEIAKLCWNVSSTHMMPYSIVNAQYMLRSIFILKKSLVISLVSKSNDYFLQCLNLCCIFRQKLCIYSDFICSQVIRFFRQSNRMNNFFLLMIRFLSRVLVPFSISSAVPATLFLFRLFTIIFDIAL